MGEGRGYEDDSWVFVSHSQGVNMIMASLTDKGHYGVLKRRRVAISPYVITLVTEYELRVGY